MIVPPGSSASPGLPESLGRFQIVRRLGQGAQSVVYLAFDPQLHREVAVKALRGSADQAQALLNEARAVSRLSHAAIIPVFEAANDPATGVAYLVFEYVPGPTLAELLRQQGALEPALAVKMLLPVLDALAYAHANQVIHRDLKPSNILLDRRGLARVMDFGIAVRQNDTVDSNATDADDDELQAPVGTPAYMAPEYLQYGRISVQMDVFSAGLVLYEMLVGRRAVPGDSGLQAIHFLANTDITLPDNLPYAVDERLHNIVERALAREPQARYASADELALALRDWSAPVSLAASDSLLTAGTSGHAAATAQAVALESLLRRMRLRPEFPALPDSMVQINRLASSDQLNLDALSEAVLRDAAVTHKLLRTVNSALYRSYGGGAVSTVSRAIQLLGYGAVRTAASSLPLLDMRRDRAQAGRLLDEMLLAYFCGSLAQALSGLRARDAEEAFVCGNLQRLGPMLVSCHFTDEAAEIARLSQSRTQHPARAVRQVLGLDYETLGLGVARYWGLPDIVLRSMRSLAGPGGATSTADQPAVIAPVGRAEVLRTLSSFSSELLNAWLQESPERRQTASSLASQRYAKALALSTHEIRVASDEAEGAVRKLLQGLRLDLSQSEVAQRLGLAPTQALRTAPHMNAALHAASTQPTQPSQATQPTQPTQRTAALAECREGLAEAIQDLASRLLQPFKLSDLVLVCLQHLQRACGFRQVIFALRDPKTNTMVGRIAADNGAEGSKGPGRLSLDLNTLTDPLVQAVNQAQDLWMPVLADEATAPYRHNLGASAILLLPLQIKGQTLGLVYADFGAGAVPPLGDKELASISTLRNQMALAFRQRSV